MGDAERIVGILVKNDVDNSGCTANAANHTHHTAFPNRWRSANMLIMRLLGAHHSVVGPNPLYYLNVGCLIDGHI